MRLQAGELEIRDWEIEDAESLAKHANNRNVWINLQDSFPHPYTMADARSWIGRSRARSPATDFAIASPDEALGGIGVVLYTDVRRRTAQLGYWLAEPFWGKGIATAAVQAFTAHCFEAFDLVRLQAYVYEWNPASARVLEKAGYSLEARLGKAIVKDGRVIDAFLYARLRHET